MEIAIIKNKLENFLFNNALNLKSNFQLCQIEQDVEQTFIQLKEAERKKLQIDTNLEKQIDELIDLIKRIKTIIYEKT